MFTHRPIVVSISSFVKLSRSFGTFKSNKLICTRYLGSSLVAPLLQRPSPTFLLKAIRSLGVSANWAYKESPYEVLGVTKSTSKTDLKKAYFREAKKVHPDLNPNNPKATALFQKLSEAYEILTDDANRREYDSRSSSRNVNTNQQSGYSNNNSQQQQNQYQYKSATDTFNEAFEDVEIIKEALGLYIQDVELDIKYAVHCFRLSEWEKGIETLGSHKGLLLAMLVPVIPIIMLTRSPAAFTVVSRLFFAGASITFNALLASGNLGTAVRLLWKNMITIAKERTKRH